MEFVLCAANDFRIEDLNLLIHEINLLFNWLILFSFFFCLSHCSNGGSDKQHLDSSDESDLDTPMHNSSNNTSTTQSNTQQTAQQQQHQLQLGGSGGGTGGSGQHHHHHQHNQHGHHGPNLNSPVDGNGGLLVGNSNLSHTNSSAGTLSGLSSQGKNIGQMPALSAVAYSHLHSVMGASSMPLYDISDYQHLWL